jgi:molybdate transport system substrate-binding protein
VNTRADVLGNRLVLIAPSSSKAELAIAPRFALAQALGDGRLAIAEPDSVPAGKYARAALQSLGVWGSVAAHLAPTENVRAALMLVARGEAPFGIVYRSDAQSDPAVRVVATFPEDSHPTIVYPVAIVRTSAHPDAATFVAFVQTPAVRAIFAKHGFIAAASHDR